MNTAEIQIPYRYTVIGSVGRSRPKRYRKADVLPAEIPDLQLSETDGTFKGQLGYHQQSGHVFQGRLWFPVTYADRHGRFQDNIGKSDYEAFVIFASTKTSIGMGSINPFSIPDLEFQQDQAPVPRRKRFLAIDDAIRNVEFGEQEAGKASAARDAEDICFIDGKLHSARHEPMQRMFNNGATAWELSLGNARPQIERGDTWIVWHARPSNADAVSDLLGLQPPAKTDALRQVMDFQLEERFRDFDDRLVRIIQFALKAIVPTSGYECLLGDGSFGVADIPAELDELVFDGRRLLRKLIPTVETRQDIEPILPVALDWLEQAIDVTQHAIRHARTPVLPRSAVNPELAQQTRDWWARIEKPRREARPRLVVDDADSEALLGLSL